MTVASSRWREALSEPQEATLRALPDLGADWESSKRAKDLGDGLGYPYLTELEALGLVVGNRGWWRKSRAGVLWCRERDAAPSAGACGFEG